MRKNRERGSAMVEFALVSIPTIILFISLVQLSLTLWQYHTMAYAIREAIRYASTKGPGCWYSGNSCGTTIGTIALKIANSGLGMQTSQLNVTFTSTAGSTSCNPLSTCTSSTTSWPPASVAAGSSISIAATYPYNVIFLPLYGTPIVSSGSLSAGTQASILI
jgi:Flp pilus assembly protein TadG